VAIEILACSVVAHGCAGVGVAGGDLDVAQVDTRIEHRRDEGVSEHVWVHAWQTDAGLFCEVAQASCRAMTVHPRASVVEQDGPGGALADGPFNCSAYGRWEWDQDDLAAFAAHPKDPMSVLFTEVVKVAAGGFEDAQPQESEHGDEREVVVVGRLSRLGDRASN